MPKPGESQLKDPEYQKLPADKRKYWETGDKDSLSKKQQDKICKEAEDAAKYDKDTKKIGLAYPEKVNSYENDTYLKIDPDHGAIVRNVKEYVSAKFPHRDVPGNPAPPRPLGTLVDADTTPEKPKNPPENPSKDPNNPAGAGDPGSPLYVCHQLASYMAAMMRCLGYPVREANVRLGEGYTTYFSAKYQDAGLQVWFDGKWHFVNPFNCFYDPACSIGLYSRFNWWDLLIWDGTRPPYSWAPIDTDGKPGGWMKAKEKDNSNDLQKRFYSLLPNDEDALLNGFRSDGVHLASVYDFNQVQGNLSGFIITSSTPGVQLYLTDAEGNIYDGAHEQIPGASRIAAGSVNPILMGWTVGEEHVELPLIKQDTVFFGTRSLLARYDEIGTHQLYLNVLAKPGNDIALEAHALVGFHPVSISRIPPSVPVHHPNTRIPFSVTIDPIDPMFHLHFKSQLCHDKEHDSDCCCSSCCCKYKREQYIDLENWFIATTRRRHT